MKKKITSVILTISIIMSLFAVTASAYYGEDEKTYTDGIFSYILDENGNASITDCSDTKSKSITIPAKVGNYDVKNVSVAGVVEKSSVKEIIFSEGIKTLKGYGLTEECNVKKIWLPKSLKTVEEAVLTNSSFCNLKDIYYAGTPLQWCNVDFLTYGDMENSAIYNATVHYNCEEDYVAAWDGDFEYVVDREQVVVTDCSLVDSTKIEIPENLGGYPVVAIGPYAFYKNTDNVAPDTDTKFSYKKVVLPEGIKIISTGAFFRSELEKINFPESLDSIGVDAFANTRLTELDLPGIMSRIGRFAFSETNVSEVVVPYGITVMEYAAFGTNDLATLKISQTVTKIESIFDIPPMDHTVSIYLSKNIKSVGEILFWSEYLKLEIFYEGNETEWKSLDFGEQGIRDPLKNVTIHYNSEMDYAVKEVAEQGSDYTYIETTDEIIITDYNENATGEVIIPDNINNKPVRGIGDEAFKDCVNITGIELPTTIETIGKSAFENSGIVSFVIPENVEVIESRLFYQCANLESVQIPQKIKLIEAEAFEKCEKLENVYYTGTEDDWNKISISEDANSTLTKAENHYGKTMPEKQKILGVMLVIIVLLAIVAVVIIIVLINIKKKNSAYAQTVK